jgi:parvulin-like peptidyl-prolyl isomerase
MHTRPATRPPEASVAIRSPRVRPITTRTLIGVVAAVALALPATNALAQGDAEPSEVVVARLGDATVTLDAFELRFEAAVRSTLAQQGAEPDPEAAATFDAQRPVFLEQLGQELVLSAHAQDLGIAVEEAEVDAVIEQAREEHGASFDDALAEIGFASEDAFETAVRRSLNAQRAVEALRAEVEVDDAAVEAWYEANPDQVTGPDGPVPLDDLREPIAGLLVDEQVQERIAELMAESELELHPDRI